MQAIVDYLMLNVPFVATLPGGIYNADSVDEISRQTTPGAFDSNNEILPCLIVRGADLIQTEISIMQELALDCYAYHRVGGQELRATGDRLYRMLHRRRIASYSMQFRWLFLGEVTNQRDDALECRVSIIRFGAAILRPQGDA